MRNLMALLLTAALTLPATAASPIEKQAAKIPVGMPVEVKLKNKQPLRGQMGEVFPGGFVVTLWGDRRPEPRRIMFDDAESVKQLGRASVRSHVLFFAWLAGLVAVGGAVGKAVR